MQLQTGWFSSQVLDILRLRVAQRFLSIYPDGGAQSLLKSVTNRFEKLKILQITMKEKREKQTDKGLNKISHSTINSLIVSDSFGRICRSHTNLVHLKTLDTYTSTPRILDPFQAFC